MLIIKLKTRKTFRFIIHANHLTYASETIQKTSIIQTSHLFKNEGLTQIDVDKGTSMFWKLLNSADEII